MSNDDIVQDFLVESAENLDRLDRDLVGLEKNRHQRCTVNGSEDDDGESLKAVGF
jgi:chemotaxis protein histidine kinase CheA